LEPHQPTGAIQILVKNSFLESLGAIVSPKGIKSRIFTLSFGVTYRGATSPAPPPPPPHSSRHRWTSALFAPPSASSKGGGGVGVGRRTQRPSVAGGAGVAVANPRRGMSHESFTLTDSRLPLVQPLAARLRWLAYPVRDGGCRGTASGTGCIVGHAKSSLLAACGRDSVLGPRSLRVNL